MTAMPKGKASEEYGRFEALTKALVAVPKSEIGKQASKQKAARPKASSKSARSRSTKR